MPNQCPMTKNTFTRRELARQALAGTAGVLLAARSLAAPQVVDPLPAVPPPLPTPQSNPQSNPQSKTPMTPTPTAPPPTEGELLTRLVPVTAGYTLSETQAREAAAQLKDYPGGFAKARAYVLADDIGPAFAADAPVRKERVK